MRPLLLHALAVQEDKQVSELSSLDDAPSIRLESIAVKLNVSLSTIIRMAAADRLHVERIGPRALRVRPSEVRRLLAEIAAGHSGPELPPRLSA